MIEELTISQAARRAGTRPSTIRYYESIGLLPAARRVAGRRRYDAAIVERLAFIQVTQRLGFSLAEIQQLFDTQQAGSALPSLWQQFARQKLADMARLIAQAHEIEQLLRQGLRCACAELDACIDCVLAECDTPQAGCC